MDFLGVGPMELFFILIIALIILGPKDMQKTGRTLGKWLNSFVRSDTWKMVKQASNKIKYLPNELMREAGIEEMNKIGKDISANLKNNIENGLKDPFEPWANKAPGEKIYPSSFDSQSVSEEKLQVNNNKIGTEKEGE